MDDIISQIIEIDSTVYEDHITKEEALKKRKISLEKQIKEYADKQISDAEKTATDILEKTAEDIKNQNQILEEKKRSLHTKTEKRYNEIKDSLKEEVMNKLFVVG